MMIVLLAELVSTSVRLALSLKVISIISTPRLAQSVVLVQMFVLLKQFIRENNTIPVSKTKAWADKLPALFLYPHVGFSSLPPHSYFLHTDNTLVHRYEHFVPSVENKMFVQYGTRCLYDMKQNVYLNETECSP